MNAKDLHPLMNNPFQLPGRWYRGNLHTHTTRSDGAWSPGQVAEWYAQHGYDFIAFTEHERVTDREAIRSLSLGDHQTNGLLVLPGVELSVGHSHQGAPVHVVVVGDITDLPAFNSLTLGQALAWGWQSGAFVFLAHPYWSGMSTEELMALDGVGAIESFNNASDLENHKGWATVYWDNMLARGKVTFGVATDDSHFHEADHGGGWVMVKAPELTPSAIIAALRAGHFYSSAGPLIHNIQLVDDRLYVETSPAIGIYWISSGCFGWHVHAPPGQTLTAADFYVPGGLEWIRIEVCDAQRRWAWSNPLFLGAS